MNSSWLFLDTHIPRQSRLGWIRVDGRSSLRMYPERPVALLRQLFGRDRAKLMSCEGVCVVAGPGSFSAIRTGVLYANVLARLLKRPLVALSVAESATLEDIQGALKQHRSSPLEYVAPIYDAEPNITVPRAV